MKSLRYALLALAIASTATIASAQNVPAVGNGISGGGGGGGTAMSTPNPGYFFARKVGCTQPASAPQSGALNTQTDCSSTTHSEGIVGFGSSTSAATQGSIQGVFDSTGIGWYFNSNAGVPISFNFGPASALNIDGTTGNWDLGNGFRALKPDGTNMAVSSGVCTDGTGFLTTTGCASGGAAMSAANPGYFWATKAACNALTVEPSGHFIGALSSTTGCTASGGPSGRIAFGDASSSNARISWIQGEFDFIDSAGTGGSPVNYYFSGNGNAPRMQVNNSFLFNRKIGSSVLDPSTSVCTDVNSFLTTVGCSSGGSPVYRGGTAIASPMTVINTVAFTLTATCATSTNCSFSSTPYSFSGSERWNTTAPVCTFNSAISLGTGKVALVAGSYVSNTWQIDSITSVGPTSLANGDSGSTAFHCIGAP